MDTTDKGRLGEIKVAAYLVEQGWYVFFDQSGKCSIDLIAWKDGIVATYQVRSSAYRIKNSWGVMLKSSRPNRSKNITKDWEGISDYLGVYLIKEDRVVIIPSSEITQKTQINIPCLKP